MSQARPYITIAADTTYEVTIKKSRFICSLARVTNEAAAQAFISQITKEHRKATHNCFAYLLGDHDQIQRESDNGEPSGTAGVPILEALKLEHLHDVCAVVTPLLRRDQARGRGIDSGLQQHDDRRDSPSRPN